jgi:CheY-like chemotaxis protein/transcriptional regulator with XRE-family HTH domain
MALIHIIDDDVTVLSSLVDQLSAEGFNVTTSNTLESGLVSVSEHRPDLLILEVRCGQGAGWQALEQIAPLMAVMVLSGAAREEDIVRGFDFGAIDYLAKPYRSGELLARVRIRVAASVERALLEEAFGESVSQDDFAAATGMTRQSPAQIPAPYLPQSAPYLPQSAPAYADQPAAAAAAPAASTAVRRQRRTNPTDETVFMSDAEEMAMLRSSSSTALNAEVIVGPDATFGERLRAERMRRHMSLVQLENELKIRMTYLQAIEDEKLTLLPRGPAALQMLRAYGNYYGLDSTEVEAYYRANFSAEPQALAAPLGYRPTKPLPMRLILALLILVLIVAALGTAVYLDPSLLKLVGITR